MTADTSAGPHLLESFCAKTASLTYSMESSATYKTLVIRSENVQRTTLQLRTSWFAEGDEMMVRRGRRVITKHRVAYDLRHLLTQVRADGIRHDLSLGSLTLNFR